METVPVQLIAQAALPHETQLQIARTGTAAEVEALCRNPHLAHGAWVHLLSRKLPSNQVSWLAAAPVGAGHVDEFHSLERRTTPVLIAITCWGMTDALDARLAKHKVAYNLAEILLCRDDVSDELNEHAVRFANAGTRMRWSARSGHPNLVSTAVRLTAEAAWAAGNRTAGRWIERHPDATVPLLGALDLDAGRDTRSLIGSTSFLTPQWADAIIDATRFPAEQWAIVGTSGITAVAINPATQPNALARLRRLAATPLDEPNPKQYRRSGKDRIIADVAAALALRDTSGLGAGIDTTLDEISDPKVLDRVLRYVTALGAAKVPHLSGHIAGWALHRLALNPAIARADVATFRIAAETCAGTVDAEARGVINAAGRTLGLDLDLDETRDLDGDRAAVESTLRRHAKYLAHATKDRGDEIAGRPVTDLLNPDVSEKMTAWFDSKVGRDPQTWTVLLEVIADFEGTCAEAVTIAVALRA